MTTAEVSIYVEVRDVPELIKAARQRVIDDGLAGDMETASEIVADDDVSCALRIILDPGESPPGCNILDCNCEVSS
jgi:hypothetical protein